MGRVISRILVVWQNSLANLKCYLKTLVVLDMAVLFASKLNVCNIFWPMFTKLLPFCLHGFPGNVRRLLATLVNLSAARKTEI